MKRTGSRSGPRKREAPTGKEAASKAAQDTFKGEIPSYEKKPRRKGGRLKIVWFTPAEQEVIELAWAAPFRTYREIGEILTKRHPRHPVSEAAVKQRMSGLGIRCLRAKALWNHYYEGTRARRRLRRGQEP